MYKCICAENARKAFDFRTRCFHCNPPELSAAAALPLPKPEPVFTNAVSREVREPIAA